VPPQVRIIISLALTLIFVPLAVPTGALPTDILPLALMAAREACIGFGIGFIITMVFMAIETAGSFIDMTAGFAFATTIDPVHGTNSALAARMHNLLAGLLFFVTNSHHLVVKGLADSFVLAPIGEMSFNPAVTSGMTDLFISLFLIALRIAMPVMAAVFLADLAMAITSRIVPQMNVLMVGFPLKMGVGMVGMIVAVPIVAAMSTNMFADMYNQMGGLVRLMAIH
jgi:flagellar biosynthetic protein FliR